MAGVLEQKKGSGRKLIKDNASSARIDQRVLELQVAMEILAEVFGTDVAEIDEMLRQRYDEGLERMERSNICRRQRQPLLKHRCHEMGAWPMEFCLAERIQHIS